MSDSPETKQPIVKANQHSDHDKFTLIAFLIPPVGLILGIALLVKDRDLDKKLGEHLIASSILFSILWPVAWLLLVTPYVI